MTVSDVIEVEGDAPCVLYRFYDEAGALLYVGVTGDPVGRFGDHARGKPWWPDVARKTAALCANREIALKHEREAIASERPLHNIRAGEVPLILPVARLAEPPVDDEELPARTRTLVAKAAAQRHLASEDFWRRWGHVETLVKALEMTQRELDRARCGHRPEAVVVDGRCRRCGQRMEEVA